jgi:hypothetical protein
MSLCTYKGYREQQRRDFESVRVQINRASRLLDSECQGIANQNKALHAETSLQLTEQTDLLRSGLFVSRKHFLAIQDDFARFQGSLNPVAANISALSNTLPQIASSVSKLVSLIPHPICLPQILMMKKEAKLDHLNPHSISTDYLRSDYTECQVVSRRITKYKMSPRRLISPCSCPVRTNDNLYLHGLIHLQTTQKIIHNEHCPHAVHEHTLLDISLRFSVCILALRRKFQVAFKISQLAGSSTIEHTVGHYRVVPYSSPAFRLFEAGHRDEWKRIHNTDQRTLAIDGYLQSAGTNLSLMFQKGEASPYDRVPDGRSLLHVCVLNTACLPLFHN